MLSAKTFEETGVAAAEGVASGNESSTARTEASGTVGGGRRVY